MTRDDFKSFIREKFPEFLDEDIDRLFTIVTNLEDMQKWLDKFNIQSR
jgi:hypothetical protein